MPAGAAGDARSGTFANGMDFLTWGAGPKTLLFVPGGPGSSVPRGMTGRMARTWFAPFVDAGYAVWYVTRRRGMPTGHSVADMADDYAQVIDDELGGRVDLFVGESYGGMIGLHLAARHAERLGHVAIVVAGAELSDWCKEVDARIAGALARDDRTGAGMALAEYVLPGPRSRWLRHLLGPLAARSLLSGSNYPPADVLVETQAELAFDARPVLHQISVPVVLVCGDRDRFFPQELVDATVSQIPGCELITYEGQGHMRVAASKRVPQDILGFVERHRLEQQ